MTKHPLVIALLSAALFGAATPASKGLLTDLSPFHLAALLYLGAALGVTPVAGLRRVWRLPWRIDRTNRRRLLGAILAGGILGPVLLLAGLRLASAASVSLWLNLELVATALLGHCVFHDHLSRYGWCGVATALLAAMLLSLDTDSAALRAGGLVVLACCCWGLDNHLTALIDGITPSQSTFWKGMVAGSVNLGIGLSLYPLTTTWRVMATAVCVGIWSYGVSIVLYIQAAQRLGATRGQIIFATAPFFGVLLSMVWLGEAMQIAHLLAAFLFLLAIVLLCVEEHTHRHEHTTLAHTHRHRHADGHHTHRHPGPALATEHTHWHEHAALLHAHPHWPDLHHRHAHGHEM